jgi:hypothetical protein
MAPSSRLPCQASDVTQPGGQSVAKRERDRDRLAEVGHNPFTAILYLGQYSCNPHMPGVCDEDDIFCLRVDLDRCQRNRLLQ